MLFLICLKYKNEDSVFLQFFVGHQLSLYLYKFIWVNFLPFSDKIICMWRRVLNRVEKKYLLNRVLYSIAFHRVIQPNTANPNPSYRWIQWRIHPPENRQCTYTKYNNIRDAKVYNILNKILCRCTEKHI